jgi:hypothetical protein
MAVIFARCSILVLQLDCERTVEMYEVLILRNYQRWKLRCVISNRHHVPSGYFQSSARIVDRQIPTENLLTMEFSRFSKHLLVTTVSGIYIRSTALVLIDKIAELTHIPAVTSYLLKSCEFYAFLLLSRVSPVLNPIESIELDSGLDSGLLC